jgi:probable F420-dependent oxidoreductase
MEIGLAFFSTAERMSPVELAREAELRGFHSLYLPEHTHIPTSRRTPPPTGGTELADEYRRSLDPYIALAGAAAVSERILLGTAVGLPLQHDPISLAKELATLDWMSRGRLVYGIGYGWNQEEMENHGVEPRTRRARLREHMLAMQALWSQDEAEFHGEFVRFERSWQWPKPVQQPRPRILLGGAAGPTIFRHIAEFGDGWLPFGGAGMKSALADLREVVAASGRDPASLHVVPMGVFPDPGKLDYFRELGVTEAVLRVPAGTRDEVLPVLDDYAHYLPRR